MLLGEFDRYKANCNFEVKALRDMPQTIQPDKFTVLAIDDLMTEVVLMDDEYRLRTVGLDDSGTPMVTRGYHIWLGSTRQHGVMRLTCRGAFGDMWEALPPTLAEIRHALGEIAAIELAI
jgi:hypothetical protein